MKEKVLKRRTIRKIQLGIEVEFEIRVQNFI